MTEIIHIDKNGKIVLIETIVDNKNEIIIIDEKHGVKKVKYRIPPEVKKLDELIDSIVGKR